MTVVHVKDSIELKLDEIVKINGLIKPMTDRVKDLTAEVKEEAAKALKVGETEQFGAHSITHRNGTKGKTTIVKSVDPDALVELLAREKFSAKQREMLMALVVTTETVKAAGKPVVAIKLAKK